MCAEHGEFMALDLGGTNLRLLLVTLKHGVVTDEVRQGWSHSSMVTLECLKVPSTPVLDGGAMGGLVMTDPFHHYRRPGPRRTCGYFALPGSFNRTEKPRRWGRVGESEMGGGHGGVAICRSSEA